MEWAAKSLKSGQLPTELLRNASHSLASILPTSYLRSALGVLPAPAQSDSEVLNHGVVGRIFLPIILGILTGRCKPIGKFLSFVSEREFLGYSSSFVPGLRLQC